MSHHKICKAEGCNEPIPDTRRFDADYHSDKCQAREQQRRHRKRKEVKTK